ncbi:restriction endonuclease subunit S [Staphylococcus xylosus]
MTNQEKKVPKLRFPEFDGEWEEKTIGKIATTFSGGTPSSTNRSYYNGEIPFIRSGEISKSSTELMINKEAISNSSTKMVEKGDLLYALYGATSGEVAISKISGAINQAVLCIRSQESATYIFNYLKMKKDKILKTYIQGGQGNLSASIIKKVDINLPYIEEQQKIGGFFSKLDRQIELEEQKLSLLEEQKKGYMQKIFSQELRFKDENGNDYPNWIFEELNNIFTKYQNTIYLHDNEEYKRISISNKGKITHRDITFGKTIGRKRQYLIDLKKHPNTLTFIRQGVFLGGIGFIPSSLDGYIVTENMPLLSMSEEYSKKFMTYLFSSESYYKSVIFKNLPTGSAQKALHEKDWLKSFVNIPVYSEQEKIGNFFEKQDNLIKKQSDKVELLKERKKGFLQKMFV